MALRLTLGVFASCFVLAAVACGDEGSPIDAGDAGSSTADGGGGPSDDGSNTTGDSGGQGDDDAASGSDSGSGSDAGDAGGDAGPKSCTKESDCEGKCVGGFCTAPTTSDGKISPSLGETDIDCGGSIAPACKDGLGCAIDKDCGSKVCSTSKTCVTGPSCRGTNGAPGITTCGNGEPGAPGATVESCCRSLPLPTTPNRRLDKYEITAGRIREFIGQIAAANGGQPNVRAFAKTFAMANPNSELGKVLTNFAGLLDILPTNDDPLSDLPLPVHLGAFPLDPINTLDGCYMSPGGYGHSTYWQPPSDLKPFGIGYGAPPDGKRKFSQAQLDSKPMNCVMPLLLAAFCAWDGGELARTSDYREVWGRNGVPVGATTVYIPWTALDSVGQFNWRNGHGDACPVPGWPGCQNPQPYFYQFPATGAQPQDDDTPAIGAPGRFPMDVTKITSAGGEGWLDVGGNLMESAWPNGVLSGGAGETKDVCDATTTTGGTACSRPATGATGIRRYQGTLPQIALVGYSFEGHARRSEPYLSSTTDDETKVPTGDVKPVTFQYGKVGGRCARSQ